MRHGVRLSAYTGGDLDLSTAEGAYYGLLGGFAVAENAAYVETAVAGQVFEDAEVIADLLTRFDTLRNEAFLGSESLTLIERMCEEWKATGVKAATQATTAVSA